jgi:bacterioferritin-associated ferredoxin
MIVCLCHRISDRDIRRDVAAGACCFEQLQDDSGVGRACGCCLDSAREIFDSAMAARPASGVLVGAAGVAVASVAAPASLKRPANPSFR